MIIKKKEVLDMAQATFSIRMDEDLKKELDQLCSEFGMTTSTAFTIFAKKVVRERRIPFEITSSDSEITRERGLEALRLLREEARKNGLQDMTLDEINEEIRLTREEMRRRAE